MGLRTSCPAARASLADDDWYLCHVTLLAPEEELLSWAMYPYPYLARVDPDARKGTLVYQLAARHSNSENTSAGLTYTLVAGRSCLKKKRKHLPSCRFFLSVSHLMLSVGSLRLWF